MNILDQAKKYVEKYGWSVIPIPKGQKYPIIEWKEYQKRLPSTSELAIWFNKDSKDNGLGIVMGKLSNLSVGDVDTKSPTNFFSSSIAVFSPHGKHFYFKYEESLKNWVKPTNQDWDIRTEGGLCVAPPTPGYSWVNPFFSLASLPSFPVGLIPKTVEKEQRKDPEWLAEALKGMKVGNIDSTLTSILGRLRHDGWGRDSARVFLYPHAVEAGATEGHLEDKIEHIWDSYENTKKVQVSGVSLSVDNFLAKESKVEWICHPYWAKQSLGFIVGLPESMKSWIAMDLAIECSRGGKWLGMFDTKKSRVLYIDQERALPETQRRFKALLAEKGLTKEELKGNLYVDCSSHRKMDLDSSYESFKHEIAEIQPDIIVVDSFVTFHNKPENDRMEIQKVLDRLKLIREKFGCATVFINHESKMSYQDAQDNKEPSAGRMVGSIGVVAAAESILNVKRLNAQTSAIYHTKNSLANSAESVILSLVDTPKGIKIEASK